MSMIGRLAAIDERAQEELRRDPDRFKDRLAWWDETGTRLSHMISLEKMWQAIHFMLTGVPWGGEGPLSHAVMGGEAVGIDFGYGPAGFLKPTLVRAVSAALADVDVEAFKKRFSPAAMEAEMIYPNGVWERDRATLPDELAHYFKLLVTFYRDVASRGDGVLLWIS